MTLQGGASDFFGRAVALPLTRIPGGEAILRAICKGPGKYLLPPPDVRILIDRDYRFSALGTLAQAYPEEVKATFQHWVGDD
jgi:hypothetical protein